MLESYFLFKQMTSYTTKARGMPSLSVKVVSWEITHPKSLNMSSSFKGLSREKSAVSGWEQGARTEKKGLQGGVRGTLGEKRVLGSHHHFSAKRGACEGKAEAAIPAFGWYHVKLSASSLFLLRGFVSHANSGSGPNSSGQALHPNWQEQEKEGGDSDERGCKGIARGECSGHVQNASSFRPLMSCLCPPWESCGGTKAPLSLAPLHSLFFQDEWIFQKQQLIVSHNRRRLSQFYAAFPVRGGSLSAGIEGCCDAARTTRGCPGNTLWFREEDEGEGGSSQPHTYIAYKHTACTNTL